MSLTVYLTVASENLCSIEKQVTPAFNIVFTVDAIDEFTVRHSFNIGSGVCERHSAILTSKREKVKRSAGRKCIFEALFKVQHTVIGFYFERFDTPVCFAYLEYSHRYFFKMTADIKMKRNGYRTILQAVPVNIGEKRYTHLSGINCTKLYLRIAAALTGNVSAAFDNIFIFKSILLSFFRCDLTSPEVAAAVALDCFYKCVRYRVHWFPPLK